MGVSSRHGSFAIGVQSAKGTPATDPVVKMFLSGAPSIGPDKQRERYAMTDNNRDLGASFTSGVFVQGDVPIYAHPDLMSILSWLVLGDNADSGSDPNYTHTATPAADVPWITCWRMVAGVIVEKYVDCKLSSFQFEAAAGAAAGITLSFIGCTSTFEAADTAVDASADPGFIMWEADGLISIEGSARACHRVSIGCNNNHSGYQADGLTYEDVDPGGREFSFGFATRFSSPTAFPSYREFFYGSNVGTTLSGAVTTKAVSVTFRRNANLEWNVVFPEVTYQPFQVQPDPGGDPLEYEVACFVERPASGSISTWTTKDQKATPDEAP